MFYGATATGGYKPAGYPGGYYQYPPGVPAYGVPQSAVPSSAPAQRPQTVPSTPGSPQMSRIGNVQLQHTLGKGTYGKVHFGVDDQTKEQVAVKVIDKVRMKELGADKHLMREVAIHGQIEHPYIAKMKGTKEEGDKMALVLEHVSAGTLFDLIAKSGALDERRANKYFMQLIDAVEYLHNSKVAHRDIKLENILLDGKDNIKLIDLGIANTYQTNPLLVSQCGAQEYQAPEVFQGRGYDPQKADIWGCGVVLAALLIGFLPLDRWEPVRHFQTVMVSGSIPGTKIVLSTAVRSLINRLLDKNPDTRVAFEEIRKHPWFNAFGHKSVGPLPGVKITPPSGPLPDPHRSSVTSQDGILSKAADPTTRTTSSAEAKEKEKESIDKSAATATTMVDSSQKEKETEADKTTQQKETEDKKEKTELKRMDSLKVPPPGSPKPPKKTVAQPPQQQQPMQVPPPVSAQPQQQPVTMPPTQRVLTGGVQLQAYMPGYPTTTTTTTGGLQNAPWTTPSRPTTVQYVGAPQTTTTSASRTVHAGTYGGVRMASPSPGVYTHMMPMQSPYGYR
uniref:Protein kinase domain-containing protein n=1 Tax=Chromera velia CCMP2878 TaxID=1169474 RepID=A0A0G4IA65_9ALVE|eukprot:Cvel_12385.t1-p1 / transcript=Cvel_12385.t1 / gene=Cvel_12385 / organism=Chromera_velia_CCMP2878 / gene_product=CBL-interacting protein kinase 31, putative / transcript_product=CBL-interacting protein kinase 31, putative / location=Cvel_scaffold809:14727-21724(+) / protein_length=561 / sequence_SO=supercontig / SO=protein_coding / is_pseudo=false